MNEKREALTEETKGWSYCSKCGRHWLWHTFAKHGGSPICPVI